MRFIDIEQLRRLSLLPEKWEEKAQAVAEEVRAAAPGQRAAIIDKHADLWRDLGSALAHLSHGKCWYCESRQERSDNAVDHFRPKNRVAECESHEGYWWLAFDWRNYRFSCTFCNSHRRHKEGGTSGGKHDHFPLLDEQARAFNETDDLRRENPLLLDPTCATDKLLLYFDDEGRAQPRFSQAQRPVQFQRAEASIRLYHLNHADIVEARREMCREIRQWVSDGNNLFDLLSLTNPEAKGALDAIVRKVEHEMSERAEYSAAVRDTVHGMRDDQHDWIDAL